MDRKEIALLKADLEERYKTIDRIYITIIERESTFRDTVEGVEGISYHLHNLYGAYEQLFEVVAHFFENQIGGNRYHADLLRRMITEIKGVRPALITEPTWELLHELQGFFHFFRHAYGEKLDVDRIEKLFQIAIKLKKPFYQEMQKFIERLS